MKKIFNVPNSVTLIGIVFVFLYVRAYLNQKWYLALVYFCIICLSDALDGILARALNQQTKFGQIIDDVRDVLFYAAIFVHLVLLNMKL